MSKLCQNLKSILSLGWGWLVFSETGLAEDKIQHSFSHTGTIEFTNTGSKLSSPITRVYRYTTPDDITVFTNIKPHYHGEIETLKYNCFNCSTNAEINWQSTPLNHAAFSNEVFLAAKKYQIEPALVRAVIHAESGFNHNALSVKGAQGLMQLMPTTASQLGVDDPFDPKQNIDGGSQYLALLLKQFKGELVLAIAAYNAGPNAVKKYGTIPPFDETQVFVERVTTLYERYRGGN